jgi:hypothetical protein
MLLSRCEAGRARTSSQACVKTNFADHRQCTQRCSFNTTSFISNSPWVAKSGSAQQTLILDVRANSTRALCRRGQKSTLRRVMFVPMTEPVEGRTRGDQPPDSGDRRNLRGAIVSTLAGAATAIYCAWWIIAPPDGCALFFPIGVLGLVAASLILLVVLLWLDTRR